MAQGRGATHSPSAAAHREEITYTHASGMVKIAAVFPAGTGLKIFDGGCGDARLSSELARHGHHVRGLDANESGVREAKKKGVDAVVGDLETRWPVEKEGQDVVLLLDVLEHTVNPSFVLHEARRALKKDGYLIATYLNHFDLRSRLMMLIGRKGIVHWDHFQYGSRAWSYTHYRYLTRREFTELLTESGFGIEVEQFNFMGGGLVPRRFTPAFLRKWLVGTWPALFSGKFIVRARPSSGNTTQRPRQVLLPATPEGL